MSETTPDTPARGRRRARGTWTTTVKEISKAATRLTGMRYCTSCGHSRQADGFVRNGSRYRCSVCAEATKRGQA